MAKVTISKKSCAVNPLKMSQPIGAALAFMGIKNAMPLLHGSQGCTAFGLVLFVRHFREMIPLQTTAMNEVTTILGGMDNIEEAIVNIYNRAKPALIGLCSTGLTEIKGDDVEAYLQLIRKNTRSWKRLKSYTLRRQISKAPSRMAGCRRWRKPWLPWFHTARKR